MRLFLLLIQILILSSCSLMKSEATVQTGVTVDSIQKEGKPFYRITSIGMASDSSIEKQNALMMATTSCDASKILAYNKMKEFESNPQILESTVKLIGTNTTQNGKYCFKEFHYPKL